MLSLYFYAVQCFFYLSTCARKLSCLCVQFRGPFLSEWHWNSISLLLVIYHKSTSVRTIYIYTMLVVCMKLFPIFAHIWQVFPFFRRNNPQHMEKVWLCTVKCWNKEDPTVLMLSDQTKREINLACQCLHLQSFVPKIFFKVVIKCSHFICFYVCICISTYTYTYTFLPLEATNS